MRCIEISGSDDRMDCRESFYDPLNPLPQKCRKCGFPNLDHIPQPYFLIKSRTISSNELALAENGNFFVRSRVQRVLELLAPGQCTYYPTCFKGTSEQTPWLLAVPSHQVEIGRVHPSIPRCGACGEPRSAHPGSQYSEVLFGRLSESNHEILKSSTWGSSERGWDQWVFRYLFMSLRLLHLLKKIKARGFYEATCDKPTALDNAESAWIKGKLEDLQASGIPLHADGTLSAGDAEWFRDYLKSHSRGGTQTFDIKQYERRLKIKLPKSYVDFVAKVGTMSFNDVDEQEGFNARVLALDEIDAESYRAGAIDSDDEETNAIDGVVFAGTLHGDCFCFDIQKGKKEYAVFLFKHEYNCFEPYADNFAACIKRFAGGKSD